MYTYIELSETLVGLVRSWTQSRSFILKFLESSKFQRALGHSCAFEVQEVMYIELK